MTQSTVYPQRAVTVDAVVPASPEVVFAYVADTRNDPEWCPNVGPVVQTRGEGVEVGARFEFEQTVEARGQHMISDVDVEIIGIEGNTVTWRVEDRFQIREVTLAVVPHAEGSKVIQRTEPAFKRKPATTVKLLYPFLARKTFRDQFEHLADHFSD